jgi:hypothetical protein
MTFHRRPMLSAPEALAYGSRRIYMNLRSLKALTSSALRLNHSPFIASLKR